MKCFVLSVLLSGCIAVGVKAKCIEHISFYNSPDSLPRLSGVPVMLRASLMPSSIRPDLYKAGLGFFCLKELQVEKSIKVPLKFRLGTLDYCNHLEGKDIFNR